MRPGGLRSTHAFQNRRHGYYHLFAIINLRKNRPVLSSSYSLSGFHVTVQKREPCLSRLMNWSGRIPRPPKLPLTACPHVGATGSPSCLPLPLQEGDPLSPILPRASMRSDPSEDCTPPGWSSFASALAAPTDGLSAAWGYRSQGSAGDSGRSHPAITGILSNPVRTPGRPDYRFWRCARTR